MGSTEVEREVAAAGRGGGSRQDRILGIVAGAMLVAAMVLLMVGGPTDGAIPAAGGPPRLELVSPVDGAEMEGRLELVFTAGGAELAALPSGWGTADLHVHAEVDGVERMPAMADIHRSGDHYTWIVTDPPTGEVAVRLLWSDARHRPIAEGASGTVTVTIRP